jgi:hypothetical protein
MVQTIPAGSLLITGINLTAEEETLLLQVDMSAPLAPNIMLLHVKTQKPKIVLDFMGADGPGLPGHLESPSSIAKDIRIGRHEDKLRVVIDLIPGFDYQVEQALIPEPGSYILGLKLKVPDQINGAGQEEIVEETIP